MVVVRGRWGLRNCPSKSFLEVIKDLSFLIRMMRYLVRNYLKVIS